MTEIVETHSTVFKGVWIPAEVWSSKLTLFQKCLWATVDSLGKKSRPCRASNEWLAARMQTSAGNIAVELGKLRKLGFIQNISFDGRKREILAVIPDAEALSALSCSLTQPLATAKGSLQLQLKTNGVAYIEENKVENNRALTAKQKPASKAKPASLEECRAYFKELGLTVSDADSFYHGKEGNGWKNGSNAVKDWKATVRSWKAGGYFPSQKQQKGFNKPQPAPFVTGTRNL